MDSWPTMTVETSCKAARSSLVGSPGVLSAPEEGAAPLPVSAMFRLPDWVSRLRWDTNRVWITHLWWRHYPFGPMCDGWTTPGTSPGGRAREGTRDGRSHVGSERERPDPVGRLPLAGAAGDLVARGGLPGARQQGRRGRGCRAQRGRGGRRGRAAAVRGRGQEGR